MEYANTHLTPYHYNRYGRQMIMEEIGREGQERISKTKVAVVGAGGLGSSALFYIAGAGVHSILIIDDDKVAISNLHRQIIHNENFVGKSKVESAKYQLNLYNSSVKIEIEESRLTSQNGINLLKDFDIFVDCSDNAPTRYLLNDLSILLNKPLVSGSALQTYGQISVFNYPPLEEGKEEGRKGCYKCLFPTIIEMGNCSDNGVVGPVTGVIGSLQAMETLKISLLKPPSDLLTGRLLMIDLFDCQFRTIKLTERKKNCESCGENSKLSKENLFNYDQIFQNCINSPPYLGFDFSQNEISCKEFENDFIRGKKEHILLDVRDHVQHHLASLPLSIHIPLSDLNEHLDELRKLQTDHLIVYCRRGNSSRTATKILIENGFTNVYNLQGGVTSWHFDVDPSFPLY